MKTTATLTLLLVGALICNAGDAIRLKISGNNYSDETIIRFMNGATNGLDNDYDAAKLFSPNKKVPSIYTMVDDFQPLAVNSYPVLADGGVNVSIYVKNYIATSYTIGYEEFGAIPSNACIYLEDLTTGTLYDLRSLITCTFTLAADSVSKTPHFIAHVITPSSFSVNAASCSNTANGTVSITKLGTEKWNYNIKSGSGAIVKADSNVNAEVLISGLFAGDYELNIFSKYGCTETFPVNIPFLASPKASFISSADSVYMNDATVLFSNQSEEAVEYVWDFGDKILDSLSSDPIHTYSNIGMYTVNLIAKNGGCMDVYTKSIYVLPDTTVVPDTTAAVITTGINSVKNSTEIKVYSSSEGIVIDMSHGAEINHTVSVFNSIGQLLYIENISASVQKHVVPHVENSNTVLFIQVSSSKETFTKKILDHE